MTQAELNFSGPDLNGHDRRRLGKQLGAVIRLMADERWRTHAEIRSVVPGTETAIAARLRDMRNKLGYRVEKRRVAGTEGLWEYRVVLS